MSSTNPYRAVATLLALLWLSSHTLPCLPAPRGQEPKPPASTLTKEQKEELDHLNQQAIQAHGEGDLKTAGQFWQQGLDDATLLHDQVYVAMFLNNLGIVYNDLGQNDKALDYYTRALALREQIGNPVDIAATFNNLGGVYTALGQNEKALDYFTRALALQEKIANPASIADSLNNLGVVYSDLGQNDKALDYYTRALGLREKSGNPASIADSLISLGTVYLALGQNDKALDYFTRALALQEKIANPASIAGTLNDLGEVYRILGQNNKALDYYTRALALYEKIGNPVSIAMSLNNLGGVYYALGQNDKALDYFTRSLSLDEKIGNPSDIAMSLNNLGGVYSALDQNDKALDFYTRALTLYEKIGNPASIAMSLNNLGSVYYTFGQSNQALDYFTRALALKEKIGNPSDIAMSLNNLGGVYYALGQNDKALDYFTRALSLDEKIGNPANIARTLNNLGLDFSNLGRLEEAEAKFEESRRLRETLSLQVGDPAQVGALQETFNHFYEQYAQLRLKRSLPEDALEMLEAGRAQGLARQIDLSERGDITHFFTTQERTTLQEQTQALRDALVQQRHAEQLAESAPPDTQTAHRKQVEEAKATTQQVQRDYDLFRDALFARYPQLREEAENRPAKFARLKTLARDHPDTLYLEWGIVSDKTSLLFALGDKEGLIPLTLPYGERALREVAQKWRAALEILGGRGVQNVNSVQQDKASADEVTLAKQAYQMLLGAAEKAGLLAAGRYTRLVLVGSGPLLEMPLAALCDANGKRLIERYALSQAFSLSLFFYRTNPERPTASLLCVADPTGAAEPTGKAHPVAVVPQQGTASPPTAQPPLPPNAQVSTPTPRPSGTQAAPSPSPPRSVFRAGFQPLPGARKEGQAVAGLFEGSKLLIGPAAREEAVTTQMKDYALLHFATHGYVIPQAIMSSGLVLAEEPSSGEGRTGEVAARGGSGQGAGVGPGYDGLLTARKIVALPQQWGRSLAAQLTVLSACETGSGTISGGEGLMGLAWAFRAAGCPSLVVSQWAINDTATQEWMLAFYGALKAGKPKDEAVQIAMLSVKQAHPSPYYWAAFELIGETTPLPK